MKSIKDKCLKRINILKILSHSSWKLSKKTLINVYKLLIGSILDYNFFLTPTFSTNNLNHLQIIQNKSVRVIFKLPKYTRISNLNQLSGLDLVQNRFQKLKELFIEKAKLFNQLIIPLIREYLNSRTSILRQDSGPTFLCSVFQLL